MGKRIYLVTGAAGLLGSNLTRQLIEAGENVRALLHSEPSKKPVPRQVESCMGDVLDMGSLDRFFTVPENTDVYVIHCASIVTLDPAYCRKVRDVNIGGTANILQQCIKHTVKKLVYVSSSSAIPEQPGDLPITEVDRFDPDDVIGYYSKTKAIASQMVLDAVSQQGLNASIVFPTGIFGPNDYGIGLVTKNIIRLVKGRIPFGVYGTINSTDVRDLANGIIACCEKGQKGEGYIMGNHCVSVRELFDAVSDASGCKRIKTFLPIGLVRILAVLAEGFSLITRISTPLTRFMLYNLVRNNNFSSQKAKLELGYQSRHLTESIQDEIKWLRSEGKI